MAKNPWTSGAQAISKLMRKDTVEVYKSVPVQNSIGEMSDELVFLTKANANVTPVPEAIGEEEQGTVRTHTYEITLDPDIELPLDSKVFIKLISVRQGMPGTLLEVSDLQSGLLGQTLTAADEKN